MNALDQLNGYLGRIQKRLQSQVVARGLMIAAAVAFFGTIGAVLFTNSLSFSESSLLWLASPCSSPLWRRWRSVW